MPSTTPINPNLSRRYPNIIWNNAIPIKGNVFALPVTAPIILNGNNSVIITILNGITPKKKPIRKRMIEKYEINSPITGDINTNQIKV